VSFEPDEIWQSDRANAALLIGVPQSVIDEMPLTDVYYLFERHNANQKIQNAKLKRR
jgi:hypothetical protein